MKITSGLFDHMVLQRNENNVCEAKIGGTYKTQGVLKALVTKSKKAEKNISIETTSTKGLEFKAILKEIPCGGPYDIRISVEDVSGKILDSLTIKDVLVGDVWILAGQSNMQGCGYMKDALKPHPLTRAFYMTDTWSIAKDPLHELYLSSDDVHTQVLGATKDASHIGVGPGVSFAQEMLKNTEVPQGLIACAHGGTSMAQWDPSLKIEGGRSLYGAMLRRFEKNGSKIAGVLWYQGCSDTDPASAAVYTQKMITFVKEVRKDFKSPTLPFVTVQISRVCGGASFIANTWNDVQEQQRLLPKSIRNLYTVPAIDLSLDDLIHISGFDQNRLGKRLAHAMQSLKFKDSSFLPPIELQSIKLVLNRLNSCCDVVISFKNVVGNLQALGRPSGFEISESAEILTNYSIFRIDLEKNKVILKTTIQFQEAASKYLYYGFGIMPYCNITDSADRPLPVFGPFKIKSNGMSTPFVRRCLISSIKEFAGTVDSLEYPENHGVLSFHERTFDGNFCSLHPEILKTAPEDKVVYYKTTLSNSVDMRVKLFFGYDGPFKIWVNRHAEFIDQRGTNPAIIDDKSILLNLAKGNHEVLIALGTNFGKAWGIFLRAECQEPKTFEGLDVDEMLKFQM